MWQLGWKPYQNDHEDANGQFEMNWEYDSALVTADRHSFFKFMARSIAEKHGLRATFMPKPFVGLTGNGCHTHIRCGATGRNLFRMRPACSGVSSWATVPRRRHRRMRRRCAPSPTHSELLQADQCAGDHLRGVLVTEHRHLFGQQPHPHDPRFPRRAGSSAGWRTARPTRTCCRR